MNIRSILIALACVLVLFSLRALAHHSLTVFDRDTEISIDGTVVEWYLGMPHAHLTIEATDANGGTAVYQLDFGNTPRMIEDNGWDESSFQPGDQVSATGSPSRLSNDTRLLVASLRQPDGEVATLRSGPEGPVAAEESRGAGEGGVAARFTAGLPMERITLPKITFSGVITTASWTDTSVTMTVRGAEEGGTEQDYQLKYVGAPLLYEAQGAHEDNYPVGTAVRVIGFIDRDEGNTVFPENLYAGEKTIGNRIRAARAALQHLGVIEP
ncbi:MAG: DUF6152 family protein [Rhodospirillaceae bacterium]|nr:DUF6152 family protein [Rhodospirillaceae bacterium]MDD9996586.1 DUF6152 family protein [Rhodospirillaceae bacterium]MDE0361213.1 DUF6152 family protein [Rhodospirillaceae bacterium]